MSLCALQWAFKQQTGKAQTKMVLISLADRSNEEFECWPSIKRLERDTELNRKTIIKCLDHLESGGFIADTGRRRGKTNSIKVYRLVGCIGREESSTENGTASAQAQKAKAVKKAVPKTGQLSNPKNGTAKQSQKRDSLNGEAVPKTEPLSSPKNGTENLPCLEPPMGGGNNTQSLGIAPAAHEHAPATETPPGFDEFKIPHWLDPELWAVWENHRRTRYTVAYTDLDRMESIGELFKAYERGQNLAEVIRHAVYRHFKHPHPLPDSVGADIPLAEIVRLYNEICAAAGMLPCNTMTPERQALIVKRVREAGMTLDDWNTFFNHAAKKPELTGKVKPREGYSKPYRAQIENLLNNKGFTKLDEELAAELNG